MLWLRYPNIRRRRIQAWGGSSTANYSFRPKYASRKSWIELWCTGPKEGSLYCRRPRLIETNIHEGSGGSFWNVPSLQFLGSIESNLREPQMPAKRRDEASWLRLPELWGRFKFPIWWPLHNGKREINRSSSLLEQHPHHIFHLRQRWQTLHIHEL